MTDQEIHEKYLKLKDYMWENFGVTPENIDEKLEEQRKRIQEDIKFLEDGVTCQLYGMKLTYKGEEKNG